MRILFIFLSTSLFASPFLPPHDTSLNEPSTWVEKEAFQSEVVLDAQRQLLELMKTHDDILGVAAPQIGIHKRIICVRMPDTQEVKTLINPQIVWKSQEKEAYPEGCFSTGYICGIVPRAETIKLCAYSPEGELIVEQHSGFTARIFQHEVDHLDGIRFPDRMDPSEPLHIVTNDLRAAYAKRWMDWDITCPRSEWLALKKGVPLTEHTAEAAPLSE